MNNEIAEQRLRNQDIVRSRRRHPADVVAWLGAVQAQEYPAARWGLALRMSGHPIDAEIERACEEGSILRTHVMRPTWHFVTPADIRWMLELTAPRVHRAMSSSNRQLELDTATQTRAAGVFERALGDHGCLTRAELGARLSRAGIAAKGVRLAMLTLYAELEGIMCSGARRGKHLTYALVAARAPRARSLSRDEALAELSSRYFNSHGPATIRDFVWWSGLSTADAKRGLEMNKARSKTIDSLTYWTVGRSRAGDSRPKGVHLLPIYDEYLVAYRDRDAVPHVGTMIRSRSSEALAFQNALVIAGQVAGTWKPIQKEGGVRVDVIPLRRLTAAERRALAEAAANYGRFIGAPVSMSIA